MKFNFIGSAYEAESLNIAAQECINLYLEQNEVTGRPALMGTPGLTTFGTLPTTPVRALWAGEGRLFAVGGTKLYEVASNGTPTDITTGDVTALENDADNSPVYIYPSGDGTQIFIISAGKAYVHNGVGLSAAPVPADDAIDDDYPGGQVGTARSAAYLDGYFIASKEGSRRFYFSSLLNSAEWVADDMSVKEGYPDAISALLADHTELWIFGTHRSTEVWRNQGIEEAAGGFVRDPSAHLHFALAAQHAVSNIDGPIWLGKDTRGSVAAYRAQGFSPVRVSTHAVEQAWSTYSTITDAIAWVQEDKGHKFWWVTFPTADATWVYDLTTKLWHRRSYYSSGAHHRHRARCGTHAFGKHLVGDHTTGVIYQMSRTAYDDNGTAIRRVRSAPAISEELKRVFYSRLQLDMEVTTSKTPDVLLDWSDDGGHNFNTARTLEASLSSRKGRVVANRLGSGRNRVFRITITDAQKVAIQDAYLDASLAGH